MHLRTALLAWSAFVAFRTCTADNIIPVSFSPRDIPRKVADCKALNRLTQEVKDIEIHYADINSDAEKTIVMEPGWPSLWHSWKYQIEEFKDEYHIVAPDHRGFASSTHPGDIESSGTWGDHVGDMVCALEHAGVNHAICMGHDWGSQICYEAARMRPDLIEGVIGMAIPYIPSAGHYVPNSALVSSLRKLAYQLFLAQNERAAAELNANPRRTLRATLRTSASPPPDAFLIDPESFLGGWKDVEEIPPIPFLTPEEEDYWVEQFEIQGFGPTLGFYTNGNRQLSWEFTHNQGNFTISQPVLSVLPLNDPVADWVVAAKLLGSEKYLPNLTTETLDAEHWLHLEHPREVNAILRKWLGAFPGGETEDTIRDDGVGRAADEL
ncbi:predicted protein [Sparassis crispa]|uniref:AB hydrolase-1 domain-containing protein n=1 Tax=Sparassis crispa TaxID=139825 RepID=A0A401GAA4_9APHY|nr:predicted protein [Sparassis crispa]GBE79079.1 predicted protein [Sparassis crispa]